MKRFLLCLALAAAAAPLPGCLLLAGAAIGAGIVYVVSDDSAEVVLERSRSAAFDACRDELKSRGVVEISDATAGFLEGKVGGSTVKIQVREETSSTVRVTVTSRKNSGVSPDPDTAEQVAQGVQKRIG